MSDQKLYPPQLEDKIPAFTEYDPTIIKIAPDLQELDQEYVEIQIPYSLNKSVSPNQVESFELLIKTVSTNRLVCMPERSKWTNSIIYDDKNIPARIKNPDEIKRNGKLYFYIHKQYFHIGQYYKMQLACIGGGGLVGYYSTPAIVRYIAKPELSILELANQTNAAVVKKLTGVFNPKDSGEFLYKSMFTVSDAETGEIIEQSEEILHNNSDTDVYGLSLEEFVLHNELLLDKTYYISYKIITGNLYEDTITYTIKQSPSIPPQINSELKAELNYEEGLIDISLQGEFSDFTSGHFILLRTDNKSNFSQWDILKEIELDNISTQNLHLYTDYYIEYGVDYQYAIQQYNLTYNFYSAKKTSNLVAAYFEHMFLVRDNIQLKLSFNPQVNNFKEIVLENKSNTIGAKYPFIRRNGHTDFHEFGISGLLSAKTDSLNCFIDSNILSVDLDDNNFAIEKEYRDKVLSWINDGTPKFFKSPAEGSYIVYAMNISLAPQAQLSRMIYTLNASLTEIADNTIKNLIDLEILNNKTLFFGNNLHTTIISEVEDLKATNSIKLSHIQSIVCENFPKDSQLIIEPIRAIGEELVSPRERKIIRFSGNESVYNINIPLNEREIYLISWNLSKDTPKTHLKYSSTTSSQVNQKSENNFDTIVNITHFDTQYFDSYSFTSEDIISMIAEHQNFSKDIYVSAFDFLQFEKLTPILAIEPNPADKNNIYAIIDPQTKKMSYYYLGNKINDNLYDINLNGNIINIEETGEYHLDQCSYLTSIKCGLGVKLTCAYHIAAINRKG